ncbi:p-loop containing nucleoside triphosphate hydrolase protein, partial [Coniochaeta hoffmannii]
MALGPPSNRIGNHVWNLLTSLASYRERDDTNERPIVFVCHSLGGLVCKDVRRSAAPVGFRNILQYTRGIAFLGTPHHGAGLARWAELLSRSIGVVKQTNPEIVAVLRSESEVLARIQDSFHTMVMARSREGAGLIDICCFYEELPLLGVVVPRHSAILPGYIPIGIYSNYMDMARFVVADDPGFVASIALRARGRWEDVDCAGAYAFIAEECRIPGHDDPKVDVLPLVKRWLEGKGRGRWLMVIDNADDTQVFFGRRAEPATAHTSGLEEKVGSYIPDCAHGSVLVTTRNKEIGSRLANGKRPIEVGQMDEDESYRLLRAKLEDEELDRDELLVLSSRLEYLPLALVQAAAFIQENTIPVSEYLRLLGQSDQELVDLLSEEFETAGRDSETSRAVTETWILSFEQIQRQNGFAGELLSLMSLFDRQA